MTLTLHLPADLETRLRDEAARRGVDPDAFVLNTLERHLARPPSGPHFSAAETEILRQINIGLPPEDWQRYDDLRAKRESETLTVDEHATLIKLSDEIEAGNARRMAYLVQLAQMRGLELEELMRELGLQPRNEPYNA